jgi:hypothetical protein
LYSYDAAAAAAAADETSPMDETLPCTLMYGK